MMPWRERLSRLISQPPKKVPPPPAGTTIKPTSWAATPFEIWYCCSMNLGRKAERPEMISPSTPPANETWQNNNHQISVLREMLLTKIYVGLVTSAHIAAGKGLSLPSFSLLGRLVSLLRLMLAGKHWRTRALRMEAANVRRKPGHQAPTQSEEAGVKPGEDT